MLSRNISSPSNLTTCSRHRPEFKLTRWPGSSGGKTWSHNHKQFCSCVNQIRVIVFRNWINRWQTCQHFNNKCLNLISLCSTFFSVSLFCSTKIVLVTQCQCLAQKLSEIKLVWSDNWVWTKANYQSSYQEISWTAYQRFLGRSLHHVGLYQEADNSPSRHCFWQTIKYRG